MSVEIRSNDQNQPTEFGRLGPPPRPVFQSIRRGVMGNCPNCNEGRMFGKWLKVEHTCTVCDEELHHEKAQDFPPYITITIVGHIVLTLLMIVESNTDLSMITHLVIWIPLTIVLSIYLMQPVKGGVVGLQWALRMFGFGSEEEA